MRREASILARQPEAERDRPGVDTRLLPHSFPKPVSLGSLRSQSRKSLVASAPSQSPVRKPPVPPYSRPIEAAYARSALPGVDADACGIAPRMISRSALPGVDADARALPRMNARSALPGVDADACVNSRMTCSVPTRTAEGALETFTLSPSSDLYVIVIPGSDRESIPRRRGIPLSLSQVEACPELVEGGLKSGMGGAPSPGLVVRKGLLIAN